MSNDERNPNHEFQAALAGSSFVLPDLLLVSHRNPSLMTKTAVVTGAGSGVGQAIALALAKEHWKVALVGRREEMLRQTVRRAGKNSRNLLVCPCDLGDVKAVAEMAKAVLKKCGTVEV